MKKATGGILAALLVLCFICLAILGFLLIRKNEEAEELSSDVRKYKKDLKAYEEQLAKQDEDFNNEKSELLKANEELKNEKKNTETELKETKEQLEESLSHIPEKGNVTVRDDLVRIYQRSNYKDYCVANDTYDTLEYKYEMIYNYPTDVVFCGDSLVERCSWDEMYPELEVKNRGIGGDTVYGLMSRMDTIMATQPKKLFVYVGINDVLFGREPDDIINRYRELMDVIAGYEGVKVYIQSILPVSASQSDAERILLDTHEIDEALAGLCEERGFTYIWLWDEYAGDDWALLDEYYYDGVHINARAYKHWKEILDPYVYE
ncbi:MAG: hypothetical protein J6X66_15345 [Lachnospiraceae bacterium]|nr:hypothetical protein [Lachnospiraceae bacterium]